MKCLVLGGTGFLGIHLCKKLLELGYCVDVLARNNANLDRFRSLVSGAEIIEADFTECSDFDSITSNVDIVFHLISTTAPAKSNSNMVFDIESNLIPTIKLLDGCRKNGVKKVIFFSSGGTVYGIPKTLPISEEHETNPISSYGIHKLVIEKYLNLFWNLYGLDYFSVRIANPYGEYQSSYSGQGAIATFLKLALEGIPIEIWGDGSVIRDFIYVSDAIAGVLKLLEYNGEHKIFNIGSGVGYSLNEIIDSIGSAIGKNISVNYKEARSFDVPKNVLDIARITEETGWSPKIYLDEGIKITSKWLLNNIVA